MNRQYVLIKPAQTEKSTSMRDGENRYTFFVHPDANKIEIKQAVEAMFNVHVESVNVVRRRPANRERQGRVIGRKPGWKKAYVKLAAGDSIELFKGV